MQVEGVGASATAGVMWRPWSLRCLTTLHLLLPWRPATLPSSQSRQSALAPVARSRSVGSVGTFHFRTWLAASWLAASCLAVYLRPSVSLSIRLGSEFRDSFPVSPDSQYSAQALVP
jgi:hypothetical protein